MMNRQPIPARPKAEETDVIVTIQIDTATPLSTKELDLLHGLTGLNAVDFPSDAERAASEAKVAEAKAAPAAKKAAAKKAAPAKPKPEPEPDDDGEDLRAKALEIASGLLASGERE
jgi:hypothetical protein